MNKQFFCCALAMSVLLSGAAMAQKPVVVSNHQAEQGFDHKFAKFDKDHHEKMAKRLADKLSLTEEQQKQAEQIRISGQEKIKPLLDEMMELRKKIDKERRANMEEFENILTPEQKAAFEKLKAEDKAEFRKRMPKMRPMMQNNAEHHNEEQLPPPPPEDAVLPPPPMDD